mgnify:CR=1 FL=1
MDLIRRKLSCAAQRMCVGDVRSRVLGGRVPRPSLGVPQRALFNVKGVDCSAGPVAALLDSRFTGVFMLLMHLNSFARCDSRANARVLAVKWRRGCGHHLTAAAGRLVTFTIALVMHL